MRRDRWSGDVPEISVPFRSERNSAEGPGDTWFPEGDHSEWRLAVSRERPADERNPHALTFEIWRRRSAI